MLLLEFLLLILSLSNGVNNRMITSYFMWLKLQNKTEKQKKKKKEKKKKKPTFLPLTWKSYNALLGTIQGKLEEIPQLHMLVNTKSNKFSFSSPFFLFP